MFRFAGPTSQGCFFATFRFKYFVCCWKFMEYAWSKKDTGNSGYFHFERFESHLNPGDDIVSFLPLAHSYGCAFEFLFPFSLGCHITFLTKTPSPQIIIKAFNEIKPRLILSVPLISYVSWDKFKSGSAGIAVDTLEMKIDSEYPQKIVGEIMLKTATFLLKEEIKVWFLGLRVKIFIRKKLNL